MYLYTLPHFLPRSRCTLALGCTLDTGVQPGHWGLPGDTQCNEVQILNEIYCTQMKLNKIYCTLVKYCITPKEIHINIHHPTGTSLYLIWWGPYGTWSAEC